MYTVSILTLDFLMLSFSGFHLIRLIVHRTCHYLIIVLLFAPVHSGVPQCSVLGPMHFTMYIYPLSAKINSHSAMQLHTTMLTTYNHRCLIPMSKYLSYFTMCCHALVMSKLGQLRTYLNLMTTRQNSCLSPLRELSISIAYFNNLLQSLSAMLKFPSYSL